MGQKWKNEMLLFSWGIKIEQMEEGKAAVQPWDKNGTKTEGEVSIQLQDKSGTNTAEGEANG